MFRPLWVCSVGLGLYPCIERRRSLASPGTILGLAKLLFVVDDGQGHKADDERNRPQEADQGEAPGYAEIVLLLPALRQEEEDHPNHATRDPNSELEHFL